MKLSRIPYATGQDPAMPGGPGLVYRRRSRYRAFASRSIDMATSKEAFETIPVGTNVTWHYRSAIGHGTVTGVHKMGTTADNTMYSVRQHDHHPGEPPIVHHSGKALSIVKP